VAEEKTAGRRRWPEGYDPQRTRSELVASALRLFEQNGFDRTSLQQIVVDANLTKGAFYHHFESKEDLLWRIQAEYLDTQLEGAQAIVEGGRRPDRPGPRADPAQPRGRGPAPAACRDLPAGAASPHG
jgi:AcrR family transcriptional regulator